MSCASIYQAAANADNVRQYYRRYNFNAQLYLIEIKYNISIFIDMLLKSEFNSITLIRSEQ